MVRLVEVLRTWPGCEVAWQQASAAGLAAPGAYRAWMVDFCRQRGRDDLDAYWSEVGAEWVRNAGAFNPNVRSALSPLNSTGYRSTYLDQLAAEPGVAEASGRLTHPCLRRFHEENISQQGALQRERQRFFESLSREEAARAEIVSAGWTGQKKDLLPLLAPIARAYGFQPASLDKWDAHINRRGFAKKLGSGLIFYFGVDTGGGASLLVKLPIAFGISHEQSNENVYLGDLSIVIPGAEFYLFASEEILGIYALHATTQLFSIFADTFN